MVLSADLEPANQAPFLPRPTPLVLLIPLVIPRGPSRPRQWPTCRGLLPALPTYTASANCRLPILPTAYCIVPTSYILPTHTAYNINAYKCLLPTAYCLLLTAYCVLPILPILPTAYCLLPAACCLYCTISCTACCLMLPTSACYLLPAARRLLPSTVFTIYIYYLIIIPDSALPTVSVRCSALPSLFYLVLYMLQYLPLL